MRRKYRKNKLFKFQFNPRWLVWTGFIVCATAFCLAVGYTVYNAKIFKIRDEDIRSNVELDKRLKDFIRHKSLFNIDLAQIASVMMKEHPEYKSINLRKLFPRTIQINIDKREVFAQIKGRRFYPVDREAIVLSNGNSEAFKGLIPIEMPIEAGYLHTGQRVDNSTLEAAFELIENLRQHNFLDEFTVSLVNIMNKQNMYFLMRPRNFSVEGQFPSEAIKVIVGEADIAAKVRLLVSLLGGELRDKLPMVQYIDLRHKKVYVGFQR